jgi:thiol oxidase
MMLEEGYAAIGGARSFTTAAALSPRLRASLLAALGGALGGGDGGGEFKVTVLLLWGGARCAEARAALAPLLAGVPGSDALAGAASGDAEGLLLTHAQRLAPRRPPPIRVEAFGAPRASAAAKDSAWVAQRRGLEAAKGAGVEEVLLVGEGGGALEGLQTNFFAVDGGGVLRTAREGVLAGTVRGLVLDVCAREGIPVVMDAPALAGAAAWRGAFLTSTSRLLLPVDELAWGGHAPVPLHSRVDPLVVRLEALVEGEVAARSEEVLPAGVDVGVLQRLLADAGDDGALEAAIREEAQKRRFAPHPGAPSEAPH